MRTSTIVIIVVVVIVVIGGIFWYSQSQSSVATTPPSTSTTIPSAQTLTVGQNSTIGNYLEATNGMTLYTYANDTVGTSTCSGDCATTWPPYTVQSADGLALDPAASGSIGTITRADGTLQVTYNGMPLYLYAQDVNPGDTNGQGVGGVWNVATP